MHDRFFAHNPKEFIRTLGLLSEYSLPQLVKAVETIHATGARVQVDNLQMLLGNQPPPELPVTQGEIELACEAQLRRYGREARCA